MVKEQDLIILNETAICKGVWSRILGKQKSVLDYVLIDKDDEDYLLKMTIHLFTVSEKYAHARISAIMQFHLDDKILISAMQQSF